MTYALLPLSERGEATGAYIFDRIYNFADVSSAFLVFALTAAFIFFVYVGALTTRKMLAARFGEPAHLGQCEMEDLDPRAG